MSAIQFWWAVALGLVFLVGLAGATYRTWRRRGRLCEAPTTPPPREEPGTNVPTDLETLSRQARVGLASHQANVLQLQERLADLSRRQSALSGPQMYAEVEQILRPMLNGANQISQAYEEIRQQAHLLMSISEVRKDPLTGLDNRRALEEALRDRFAMFARYGNKFSVILFDIDHLQKINETMGPMHGDRVLQQLGEFLVNAVRETDLAARYGGEEFVLVLPETDLQGACILADRVRAAIEKQFHVTLSGGVAEAADDDVPKTLLARADSALYSAKSSGRNCVFKHDGRQIVAIPVGFDAFLAVHANRPN